MGQKLSQNLKGGGGVMEMQIATCVPTLTTIDEG